MEERTMTAGLLMEAVQRQQRLAESTLDRLHGITDSLETALREELRRSFVEEFKALGDAGQRAAQALQLVRRTASLRLGLWSLAISAGCSIIPVAIVACMLPTHSEIEQLRSERARLTAAVTELKQLGGRIDLRRCGQSERLCVRVDRQASAYGPQADYLIVKGY